MTERRRLIAGNWKLHGSLAMVHQMTADIQAQLPAGRAEVVLCPPFPYLSAAVAACSHARLAIAAQDCSEESRGAYTGDVSAAMIADCGAKLVIAGHSERRHGRGETPDCVARKVVQGLQAGLQVILCVGETLAEREKGLTWPVIAEQLSAVAKRVEDWSSLIIAYEPVWAIGTGRTATPEQAGDVHAQLRVWLQVHAGPVAQQIPLLYGGSVKADNAAALLAMPDIDGALVGGASLNAEEFLAIVASAG